MSEPSLTDWLSASGSLIAAGAAIVAAVAAVVAARYTKRAALEAAHSAKSAAQQVELQRPRPIVLATFFYSSKDQQHKVDRTREFVLDNIGNSPAFDIEIGPIVLPDGYNRLITEELNYLIPGTPKTCTHKVDMTCLDKFSHS